MEQEIQYIPTVGVVVFRDDKVLLVRHKAGAGHPEGSYGLPAGRLNDGEDFVTAALRELNEETGLIAVPENLEKLDKMYYAALPRSDGTTKNYSWTVYICHQWQGELKDDHETIPEWISISQIENYPLIGNVKDAINDAIQKLNVRN